MTSPTIFETGLLVFQSQKNRCAVFFTLNLTLNQFNETIARRTLGVFLKILPASAIFALEWTSQKECFVNFYIKLEKSSLFTRARELVENINNSFIKILGAQSVQLLQGEELMTHFCMGAQGRINKITAKGRYALNVHTDIITQRKSIALINPVNPEVQSSIFKEVNSSYEIRLILPFKKEEADFIISDYFTLVSDKPNLKLDLKQEPEEPTSISRVSASKSIQIFGDVLSRNLIQDDKTKIPFQDVVNIIVKFISIPQVQREDETPPFQVNQEPLSQKMSPVAWRELIGHLASNLKLPYEPDIQIFVNRLPMRFDAKVDKFLFSIVSQTTVQQLQWIQKKVKMLLDFNDQYEIIILLTESFDTVTIRKLLSETAHSNRIYFISVKHELETILKAHKSQLQNQSPTVTQVV